jgi:hypothetical protein
MALIGMERGVHMLSATLSSCRNWWPCEMCRCIQRCLLKVFHWVCIYCAVIDYPSWEALEPSIFGEL